ncbi:MAG: hypothetical protein DCF29_03820 [Alphaproteobacteria bacterium]|nr:MAG: hypothetical protein DCF29_03820 [Alphaproteobacteria bacterium]
MRDTLFDDAQARGSIRDVASGLKLYRAGRTMRGECPVNGCSAGKKADGAFWIDENRNRWGCFSCGESGSVIDLEHILHSTGTDTIRHAAARLAGVDLAVIDAERKAREDDYRPVQGVTGSGLSVADRARSALATQDALERKAERAARRAKQDRKDADRDQWIGSLAAGLWAEGRPAAGTPVELYLRARGIEGRPLDLALQQLRYHPTAYHSGREEKALRLPAMLALIVAPLGLDVRPTGGVHVTYLAEDCDLVWRRARVDRSKTIWGDPKLSPAALLEGDDRPDRWGGAWLSRPSGPGPLIVGEGIESVLSAACLANEPVRMVAALSLNALQGGWEQDAYGRVNVDLPKADRTAPAFTWPEPEASPWGEVRICVDRDMATITRKVRKACGGTWRRPLDSDIRAQVCGGLAEQHWRHAGAKAVRIWAPAPGRDFNDELRARARAGGPTA